MEKHIMICHYGCNNSAKIILKNGNYCCSEKPSSCPGMKQKNREAVKARRNELGNNYWKAGHPKGNLGKKSPLKGKTYNEIYGDIGAAKQRKKLSSALKGHSSYNEWSEETKQRHADNARERIISRYNNGWLPKAGRCKKYNYYSPVAGDVSLDGTWELAVAMWLDINGYNWIRNKNRFEYVNLKGITSYYTPDFYVTELHSYIEVKGYETELDRCKWSQFPEKLLVWKQKELTERNIFDILNNKEGGQAGNAADC